MSQVPQAEWVEEMDDNYTISYRNTQTGEVRADDPREQPAAAGEYADGGGRGEYAEGEYAGGGEYGEGAEGDWSEHHDDDGNLYYYNAQTGESQYAET
jgi:hypothetical protein